MAEHTDTEARPMAVTSHPEDDGRVLVRVNGIWWGMCDDAAHAEALTRTLVEYGVEPFGENPDDWAPAEDAWDA